jgi:hypothetical protein
MVGNMDKCIDSRGQEYLVGIFNEISKAMGCQTPMNAITQFQQMVEELELKNPVAKNREEELEILSTSVNPVRLKNNPISLDVNTIYLLYKIIVL